GANKSQDGEDADAEPADSACPSELDGKQEGYREEDDLGNGNPIPESEDAVTGPHLAPPKGQIR
ncbi:MAG: hypothetical protein Q9179_006031, partial [Wetmoreana sp. 5 TL-2023]